MLKSRLFFYLTVFLLVGFEGAASAQTEVAFRAAYEQALSHSLETQSAQNQSALVKSNESLGEYKDDAKIMLSSSLGARLAGKDGASVRNNSTEFSVVNPNEFGLEQSHSLTLTKPLYDFGRFDAQREQLGHLSKASELEIELVKQKVLYSVARAYARLQNSERVELIAKAQLEIAQTMREAMQRNYRNGLRSEADLLKTQVDEGRAQLSLERAQTESGLARAQLATLMTGTSSFLVESNLSVRPARARDFDDWQALTSKIKKAPRADVIQRQREELKGALNAELKTIESAKKPNLNAQAFAQVPGSLFPLRPSIGLGLQLTWEIPYSGVDKGQKLQVALRQKDLTLNAQQENNLRLQKSESALRTIDRNLAQLKRLETQFQLARKLKELVKRRYESGRASSFELSAADDDVLTAQLELRNLHHQITVALIDFSEAQGVENFDELFN